MMKQTRVIAAVMLSLPIVLCGCAGPPAFSGFGGATPVVGGIVDEGIRAYVAKDAFDRMDDAYRDVLIPNPTCF